METKFIIIISVVVIILILIAIFIILFVTLRKNTNIKTFGGDNTYLDENGQEYSINGNIAIVLPNKTSKNIVINKNIDVTNNQYTVDFKSTFNGLYEDNNNLRRFIIEDDVNLEHIDPTKMFKNCTSLEELALGNMNATVPKSLSCLFYGCEKLTSIDLSVWACTVRNLGYTFYKCYSLEKIKFGNINTKSTNDVRCTFSECYNLEKLDLSSFDTKLFNSTLGMFKNCSKNTRFDIGDNIILGDNFDLKKTQFLTEMFCGCPITEFNIMHLYSDAKKLDQNNYDEMCKYIKNIKTVNIVNMFKDCIFLNLIDLRLFNKFTTALSDNLFENCGSFTEMYGDPPVKQTDGKITLPIKQRGDMRITIVNTNILNIFNKYNQNKLSNYKATNEYYYDVNCDNSFHS